MIGGRIDDNAWQTYDEWPYFQHYRVEEIRAGYYDRLDALQGQNRTYYVGGLPNGMRWSVHSRTRLAGRRGPARG